MATGSFLLDNLWTYEFYNPSFVARQFGLGQLPPRLLFRNTLKSREGISEMIEASRVFQLGSDLPSLCLHEWTRASFSNLFDSWWQEWHSHLFCSPIHPNYLALDEESPSNSEVIYYFFFQKDYLTSSPINSSNKFFYRISDLIHQAWTGKGIP